MIPVAWWVGAKLAAGSAFSFLRKVPWQAWAAAAAIGALWWLHNSRVDAAHAAGKAEADAACTEARQEADRMASRARAVRIETAASASAAHEIDRVQITKRLEESRHVVRQALAAPVACPIGSPLAVGDVLVPADALRGVRDAAGAVPGAPGD
jgi:beta-glucosidase-like glycosyl hydrolase